MMRTLILALMLGVTLASTASAHFLFVRILPAAEGGRAAEIYFSEYASAGDPRYIDRIANGEFFVQTKPGEFRPLPLRKLSDRLRGHLPVEGTLLVAGMLDYGVPVRPGQPRFLLRHYAKTVAGSPEQVNQQTPKGSPIEIVPKFQPDGVVLTALVDGQPLAKATLTIVDSDLVSKEFTTDAEGRVTFKPESPSFYCAYVSHVNPTAGDHGGEKYSEIRQFGTLSFQWPLAGGGADAEAVKLFEEALAARATWQAFPGFSAKIAGELEGRPYSGTVDVASDGAVKLDLGDDAAMAEWIEQQLGSITMHRAASQTPQANRPKPVVRFADQQTDHPLGRLVTFEGGHFATSYRIKDQQLMTVNRLLDGKNMTITVLANEKNGEGKFLPSLYSVQYWDEPTGRLERTENVHDTWIRTGKWDLPAGHTVTTANDNGFSIRSFTLSDHKLSEEKANK